MAKALLLENIHPGAAEYLRSKGYDVETQAGALDEAELISALEGVSILGIRSKTHVTAAVLDACPDLNAIGCFSIGTNQVDLPAAAVHGVAVFNAPYSNTRSVVELVISDIVALMRRVPEHTLSIRNGVWDKTAKKSHEVRGKTLGIIGYGNIGSQVSVLAESMGMSVVFYDLEEKLALGNAQRCNTMEELLRQSDAVTIHVDGRKANIGLFGNQYFDMMKQDAIFINLSRGFVTDVDALAEHLKAGHLSGAAVDVYPVEPKKVGDPFETPLTQFGNVILTPHIGGSTLEAQEAIGEFVSHKLYEYSIDGNTTLSVNMPTLNINATHGLTRIAHLHTNLPGVLAKLNNILGDQNINVAAQSLATLGNLGYVVLDVDARPDKATIEQLKNINGTIRVHIL